MSDKHLTNGIDKVDFDPTNYVLIQPGNCIIDCRKPDVIFPRKAEAIVAYREFLCSVCQCRFMIKVEAIQSYYIKCIHYECDAYIRLYNNSYYCYRPSSCNLM